MTRKTGCWSVTLFCAAFWSAVIWLLAGCSKAPANEAAGYREQERGSPVAESVQPRGTNHGISVWVDPNSGCEYLVLYDKAVTPRTEHNGAYNGASKQMGCWK